MQTSNFYEFKMTNVIKLRPTADAAASIIYHNYQQRHVLVGRFRCGMKRRGRNKSPFRGRALFSAVFDHGSPEEYPIKRASLSPHYCRFVLEVHNPSEHYRHTLLCCARACIRSYRDGQCVPEGVHTASCGRGRRPKRVTKDPRVRAPSYTN